MRLWRCRRLSKVALMSFMSTVQMMPSLWKLEFSNRLEPSWATTRLTQRTESDQQRAFLTTLFDSVHMANDNRRLQVQMTSACGHSLKRRMHSRNQNCNRELQCFKTQTAPCADTWALCPAYCGRKLKQSSRHGTAMISRLSSQAQSRPGIGGWASGRSCRL